MPKVHSIWCMVIYSQIPLQSITWYCSVDEWHFDYLSVGYHIILNKLNICLFYVLEHMCSVYHLVAEAKQSADRRRLQLSWRVVDLLTSSPTALPFASNPKTLLSILYWIYPEAEKKSWGWAFSRQRKELAFHRRRRWGTGERCKIFVVQNKQRKSKEQ